MNDEQRLRKILALLDSPHEGEAIAALLTLRAKLAARKSKLTDFLPDTTTMTAEISQLRRDNAALQAQADVDRNAAHASQQARAREAAAAAKWRALAQTTADRLWEIGRELHESDSTVLQDSDLRLVARR